MQITAQTAPSKTNPLPLFYRQDPINYGSLTVLKSDPTSIKVYSATKDMEFTFNRDELYTAADIVEELKALSVAGDGVMFRKEKIESRLSCLLQAIDGPKHALARG